MNNLFLFAIIILCLILLLALSIFSTKAAIAVFNSSEYNSQQEVRTAHQYLTIAASLSWSALVTLLLIAAVSAFAGLFSADQELTVSGRSLLLVIFAFLLIVLIITTILIVIATIKLGNLPSKDDNTTTAYRDGIIASVLGAASIGGSLIIAISYYALLQKKQEKSKIPKKSDTSLQNGESGERLQSKNE